MSKLTIATHDGTFHADEVFAISILKLIYKDAEVIRTRNPEIYQKADMRIDVGGRYNPASGDFDHHMAEGSGNRYNGIPYAACGLVWKHFWNKIAESKLVFEHIDKTLIQSIDAIDCGYSTNDHDEVFSHFTISDLIDSFNPPWYADSNESNLNFEKAIEVATKTLQNKLDHALGIKKAVNYVRDAIFYSTDPRYIVLDKYCPWQDIVLEESDALYVVFPTTETDWRVRAVPTRKGSFQLKKPLPNSWAGKNSSELSEITGIEDATFCHRACFIAGAESKEGAIALIHQALES